MLSLTDDKFINSWYGSFHPFFIFSCLKALRVLQVNGHVPPDPAAFEYYAR